MTARVDGKLGWYTRDGERLPDNAIDRVKVNAWQTQKRVGITDVGDLRVSTVFLSLDHWDPSRDPDVMLFETMVFGGDPSDHLVARYATEEEAMRGHLRILDALRAGVPLSDI